MILAPRHSAARGTLDTTFDHDTGDGHVEHRDGHYADATKRGKKVILKGPSLPLVRTGLWCRRGL